MAIINKNASKVQLADGTILNDLTADTVSAETLLVGGTAHGADGQPITGTCTFDSNTQDATVAVAEILTGKTAYVRGAKITGTMPNRANINTDITTASQSVTIQQGYHAGTGKVQISATEQAKIVPKNILKGITILGTTGTAEPSSEVTAQSKTVSPSFVSQTVLPDADTDYLSEVVVNAIPVVYTDNSAGGKTVTIG